MSLSDTVLFISTLSKECGTSLKYITNNGLPVQIVRLDTTEARNKAANGKYFQVRMVPTMVMIYDDGNMEVFIGNDKILPILSSMLASSTTVTGGTTGNGGGGWSPNPAYGALARDGGINMYGPSSNGVKPSKPVYAARPTQARDGTTSNQGGYSEDRRREIPVIEDDSGEETEIPIRREPPRKEVFRAPRVIEDNESFEDVPPRTSSKGVKGAKGSKMVRATPKSKSAKSSKGKGKNKSKKKKPPVVFEDVPLAEKTSSSRLGANEDGPLPSHGARTLSSHLDEQDQEIEIEYSSGERPVQSGESSRGVSSKKMKNSRMQGLIDRAKMMEQERLDSLGYNEADLPHYY
jgi:hypothetical protein